MYFVASKIAEYNKVDSGKGNFQIFKISISGEIFSQEKIGIYEDITYKIKICSREIKTFTNSPQHPRILIKKEIAKC